MFWLKQSLASEFWLKRSLALSWLIQKHILALVWLKRSLGFWVWNGLSSFEFDWNAFYSLKRSLHLERRRELASSNWSLVSRQDTLEPKSEATASWRVQKTGELPSWVLNLSCYRRDFRCGHSATSFLLGNLATRIQIIKIPMSF